MDEIRKGDRIICKDKEDMLRTDVEFQKAGYKTDYIFELNGKDVCVIEIKSVPAGTEGQQGEN